MPQILKPPGLKLASPQALTIYSVCQGRRRMRRTSQFLHRLPGLGVLADERGEAVRKALAGSLLLGILLQGFLGHLSQGS